MGLDKFTTQYLETALWASIDADEMALDRAARRLD